MTSYIEALRSEVSRLTRERDDAARLYGTKEALDALRDRKTLESERAAWEKRAMEAEADWRRLRVALDNLVGAVGALSDPEDQLSCIPAGPEAEELWQAWKDGEAALSGEQPPSETKPEPDVGALNRQLCETEGHVFSRFAMHHCLRCEAAVTPGGYLAYTSSQKAPETTAGVPVHYGSDGKLHLGEGPDGRRPPEKAGERPRVQPPKFCAVDGCYNRVADDQEVCDSCSQNGFGKPHE